MPKTALATRCVLAERQISMILDLGFERFDIIQEIVQNITEILDVRKTVQTAD